MSGQRVRHFQPKQMNVLEWKAMLSFPLRGQGERRRSGVQAAPSKANGGSAAAWTPPGAGAGQLGVAPRGPLPPGYPVSRAGATAGGWVVLGWGTEQSWCPSFQPEAWTEPVPVWGNFEKRTLWQGGVSHFTAEIS